MSTSRPVMFRAGRLPGPDTGLTLVHPQFGGSYVILADCSEFQMNIADAAYLAWSRAIVIRAAYGDAHDDRAWYGGARRAALHAGGARFVGIYQFLVAGQDGAAQAQAFHRLVGAIQPGEVFIADFEEGSRAVLVAWYNEMLALYGKAIAPYLWTYSGLSFGAAEGVLPVQWLAAYGVPEPSSPHKLWQFTSAFSVPGVGTCDASIFHGSIDQLAALAYQVKPAPTPPPGPKPPAPAPAPVTEDEMPAGTDLIPGVRVTASFLNGTVGQIALACDWKDKLTVAPQVRIRVHHETGGTWFDTGLHTVDGDYVYTIGSPADVNACSMEVQPWTPVAVGDLVTVGWHTNA